MQKGKPSSYQWLDALHILHGAGPSSLQLDVFHFKSMVASAARERLWELALSLQQEMLFRDLRPDASSYASLLHALRGSTAVELCKKVMNDMLSRRVTPNTAVFNAAILAASAWEQAISYYALVEDFSLKPDLVTLSSTMSACTRGSSWTLAVWLFQQAEMQHNMVTNNAALNAFSAGGHWQGALLVLDQMPGADAFSYVAVISACRSERQWQLALSLLENCPGNVVACSATIAVLEADGHWQFALALLEKMRRRGPTVAARRGSVGRSPRNETSAGNCCFECCN